MCLLGVDFTGKRVGIIGTGSSGIQMIPMIAQQASHLTVFQRTAQYAIPANNRELTEDEQEEVQKNYKQIRQNARNSRGGYTTADGEPSSKISALSVSEEERLVVFSKFWEKYSIAFNRCFCVCNHLSFNILKLIFMVGYIY